MRVCHLIHGLAPGGAEQVLVEMAAAAPAAGIDMAVVSLMRPGEGTLAPAVAAAGATVASLDLDSRWDPRAFARAVALIRGLRPVVLHSHLKHADIVGAYAARRLRLPQVSTLHVIEESTTALGSIKRRAAGIARIATVSRTIAVSAAQQDWYLRSFRADPSRVVVIRNGVRPEPPLSPEERSALRADLGLADSDVAAVMVGVMRPGKGHAELIRSAYRLPAASPVRFVVAGDGPLRPALTAAAAGLPRGRAIFAGWRSDIPRLLAACDLVVHPTLSDALPTALIHALAAGLPAVASDVGGVPEVVGDRAGVLVPPGDADALAKAVEELAEDPARRASMGGEALRRYAEEFTSEAWVLRLRHLYEAVLDKT